MGTDKTSSVRSEPRIQPAPGREYTNLAATAGRSAAADARDTPKEPAA